jgi:hypothetical protein
MKLHNLLNELTAEADLENRTPDWDAIFERVCELVPHINPAFVRYQLARYIDRFY